MSHQITTASSSSTPAITRPATSRGFPRGWAIVSSLASRTVAGAKAPAVYRRSGFHQADGDENLANPRVLRLQEGCELVAREIGIIPALGFEDLLPGGRLHHLVDGLGQGLALLRGDARRSHDGTPVGDLEINPLVFQGGRRHALTLDWRGDGDQAQLAGLDLAFEFAEPGNTGRDLAAKDGCQGLAATGERDVVDLGRVGAGPLGEETRGDVVDTARGAAGPPD